MSQPLPDETKEQRKACKSILKERVKPYTERARSVFDGPTRIGTPMELREDYYAYTYIHWLKRSTITDDNKESDEEDE